MIRLVYSNRAERLIDALNDELTTRASAPGASPFDQVHVVVPNRHVDAYLKAGLALRRGIAANLVSHELLDLLPDLLEGVRPRVHLIDLASLRGILLGVLLEEDLTQGDLSPVLDYVQGASGDVDASDLRKFQLATELSQVFLEYIHARPDVPLAWSRGELVFARTHLEEDERWQRGLWLSIFGPKGILARRSEATGELFVSLPDLLDPRSKVPLTRFALPRSLHVFGFSHIGKAFMRLFSLMSQHTDVCIYAPNPCAEFWEDMPGPSRRRPEGEGAKEGEAEGEGHEHWGDTPALRLWGRPGREQVRALNELCNFDFDDRFEDPLDAGGPTLLRQLQSDILHREPERQHPDPSFSFEHDRSLRIVSAPSPRREIEALGSEIWRLLGDDPTLRFHDIAIVVTEREAELYLPQIASVLGECGDIPFNVIDLPLSSDSRIVEAVELLLSLPFGSFGRQDLLRLCTHPSVMARFPDDSEADWVSWAERLGIVHGADRSDHEGTYIEKDILNWEQGIRRLCLGSFMTGEASLDLRTYREGPHEYLPEECSQGGQLSASRFSLLVRSLVADARFARSSRQKLSSWVRFFHLLVKSYLLPTSEREAKDLLKCVEAILSIDDGSTGDAEISYRLAYQLAMAALSEQRRTRGSYLSDGVVVSSLSSLRVIPFRVVFMVGVGEGRFPSIERKNPLDLRAARRQASDIGGRELEKYAFLEALCQTSDRIYLSYVGRDSLTGEALQPSPLVLDLRDMVAKGYLPREQGASLLFEQHPLRRYDPRYFSDLHGVAPSGLVSFIPEARREAQAQALSQHLRAHLGAQINVDPSLLARRNPEAWQQLSPLLGLVSPPRAPTAEGPEGRLSVRVTLSSLRRFLESPVQGYARFALGLDDDEEDALSIEDEPFATELPVMAGMLGDVMIEAALSRKPVERCHDEAVARLEQHGRAPTGVFAEVERSRHVGWLSAWASQLEKIEGPRGQARLGVANERGLGDLPLQPLQIDVALSPGREVRAELSGTTSLLLPERRQIVLFLRTESEKGEEARLRRERTLLRPFIEGAALIAAGAWAPGPFGAVLCHVDGVTYEEGFGGFASAEAARGYLAGLVAELLSRAHGYLLPCEAVFSWRDPHGAPPEGKLVEGAERLVRSGRHSCARGPVRDIDGFTLPEEEEARAMVARRFGPFFERGRAVS